MFIVNDSYLRKVLFFMVLLLLFTVSIRPAPAQEERPEKDTATTSIKAPPLILASTDTAVSTANTEALGGGETPYCRFPNIAIPDNDPNGVTDMQVVVDSGTIQDLGVSLVATHDWVGDLSFTLTHQDTGTSVTVFDQPGVPASTYGCEGDNIDVGLDDEATSPVEDECNVGTVPTIEGVFTPNNPLSAFDGEDLAGTWTLTAVDHEVAYSGTLNDWCIYAVTGTTGTANLTIVKDASRADGTDFLFTSTLPRATYFHQWGTTGSSDGEFLNPIDVVIDAAGNSFVTDPGNHRVQKFDANGDFLLEWGSFGTGAGQFETPDGIAVDADGNVYVTDFDGDRVQKFTNDGIYLYLWGSNGGGNGQFLRPEGIAVDTVGNVYVVDSGNNRIQKFTNNGTYLDQWGSLGGGNGQFQEPSFVALDADGNVYVTDSGNRRIQKFTSDGVYLTQWGSFGTGSGQFNGVEGITIDAVGNVYSAELQNHRVQKFNSSGAYLGQWGSLGTGNGQFDGPQGIAADAAGNIYVSDRYNDRIQKFAANFFSLDEADPDDGDAITDSRIFTGLTPGNYNITEILPNSDWSLADIACDSGTWTPDLDSQTLVLTLVDGDDVTCTFTNDGPPRLTIIKDAAPADGTDFLFTSDLPITTFLDTWGGSGTLPGLFNLPLGMAIDASGDIYVADGSNNRVQKFNANGDFLLEWGSSGSGNGQFNGPRDIAIDAAGDLYVTDRFNDRVQKFTSEGVYLDQWGGLGNGNGQFDDPIGIAIDSSGNLYVVDNGNVRVQKFNNNLVYLTQWGSLGGGDGQLNDPKFVTVDAAGNVFVSDTGNQRVQKFDNNGTYLLKWGYEDTAHPEGSFDRPEGLEVDDSGNIYVSDRFNHRIQKFDGNGNFLMMWGWGVQDGTAASQVCTSGCQAGLPGSGEGQIDGPEGIAIDGGVLYLSEATNHRVQKFGNSFSLDDAVPDDGDGVASTRVFSTLPTGSYTITEILPNGDWSLTDITCDSGSWSADLDSQSLAITLGLGDNVICTFTNSSLSTSLTIVKDANPADGTNFPFTSDLPAATYWHQWGSSGSGNGQFDIPYGIAVDATGNVFVTDKANDRVQKFDANGNFLIQWGGNGSGDGQFDSPDSVAVDSSGNVYVTDYGQHRVQKFDNNGTYVMQWGSSGSGDGQFSSPSGIDVDVMGNVYVVDEGNNRVQKFDSGGTYLTQWGSTGSGDGQFDVPAGVTVDGAGNVYVTDIFNNRVQKFDSSGTYLTQWGSMGSGDGQLAQPADVFVDPVGDVYVSDTGNNRLQKFDGDGTYLRQWGSSGSGDGQFANPTGIAMDATGNVYVVDTINNRVQKFMTNVFQLDDAEPDDGDVVTNARIFADLMAGDYMVTELLPTDWSLSTITCDGGTWSADLGSQTLSITLADGDNITCTFVDSQGGGWLVYLPFVTR